jgi:hypothetical protein
LQQIIIRVAVMQMQTPTGRLLRALIKTLDQTDESITFGTGCGVKMNVFSQPRTGRA